VSGATKKALDFTNVKEGGNFSKKAMPPGDYLAKVTKVEDAMPNDKEDKTPMWLFTFQLVQTPSATYPYYCKLQENQLWKVRNLLVAAGLNVPKKKVGVDPNKLVGKTVAVSLDDTEYNGKAQSEIGAVFSASELDGDAGVDDVDDVDDVDTEDEDEEPTPPPKKSKKTKAAPEPEPERSEEDDEDEDEDDADDDSEDDAEGDEFDAMDRSELRRAVRKAVPGTKINKSMSDDDLRNMLRNAGSDDDSEEDDDEIDIEDL
jgi:hypothetical protein